MRIISDFADYYDSAMGYGIDLNLIFKRKTKEIKYEDLNKIPKILEVKNIFKEHFPCDRNVTLSNKYPKIEFDEKILLFCNKVFPFYEIIYEKEYKSISKLTNYFFDFNSLETFLNKLNYDKWDKDSSKYSWFIHFSKKNVKEFFNYYNEKLKNNFIDIHLHFNSPIIVFGPNIQVFNPIDSNFPKNKNYYFGEINPNLKQIEFFKVYDSFSTFQEISMFIGNYLINQNNHSDISDKDKIGKHGYDKWSFRKEPKRN